MTDTVTTSWGKWTCTRCGNADLSGEHKRCPTCGDPREQHELDAMRPPDFSMPVTAPAELAVALDGADWHCGFCGTGNRRSHPSCQSCGGSREDTVSMGKVGLVGAERSAPMPERPTGGSGHPADLPDPALISARTPKRAPVRESSIFRPYRISNRVVPVAVLCVVIFVVGLLIWGFTTHAEPGTVTALRWERSTHLERWVDISDGDWAPVFDRQQIRPVNGEGGTPGIVITSCRSKHHHDETYSCGTESYTTTESYSCGSSRSCSSENNGNGSYTQRCTDVPKTCSRPVTKTRTKYCTRPIHKQWCDYMTQRWSEVSVATLSGMGHNPTWPTIIRTGDLERTVGTSTYEIDTMTTDGKASHTDTVPERIYDLWNVGDPVTLKVRNFGGVSGVVELE